MRGYARRALNVTRPNHKTFSETFYIGRILQSADSTRYYKFYYVGHYDLFGVQMPEGTKSVSFQLWGSNWVMGRSKKLDRAIAAAVRGTFPECRHNVRAVEKHGATFIKPEWNNTPPEVAKVVAEKEAKGKLPIRRRRKRQRRQLT